MHWTHPSGMSIHLDSASYPLLFHTELEWIDDISSTSFFYKLHVVVPIPDGYPETPFIKNMYEYGRRDWAWLEMIVFDDHIVLSSFYVYSADPTFQASPVERTKGLGNAMLCYALDLLRHKDTDLRYLISDDTLIRLEASGPQCTEEKRLEYESFSVADCVAILSDFGPWYEKLIKEEAHYLFQHYGLDKVDLRQLLYWFRPKKAPRMLVEIEEEVGNMNWFELQSYLHEHVDQLQTILVQWDKIKPQMELRDALQRQCCLVEDNVKLMEYYQRYGFEPEHQRIEHPLFVEMRSTLGKVMTQCHPMQGKRRRRSMHRKR